MGRLGEGKGREGPVHTRGSAREAETPSSAPCHTEGTKDCAVTMSPSKVIQKCRTMSIPCRYPGPQLTSENPTPSFTLPCGSPHPLLSLPFQISMARGRPARPVRKLLPQPGEEVGGSWELILHGPPPDGPAVRAWMLARPQQGREASSVMAIRQGS